MILYEEAAQNGVKVLLSGFGGDEGVSNSGSGILKELVKEKRNSQLNDLILTNDKRKASLIFCLLINTGYYNWHPGLSRFLKVLNANHFPDLLPWKRVIQRISNSTTLQGAGVFPNYPDVRKRQHFRINHSYVSDRLEASYLNAGRWGIEYTLPFSGCETCRILLFAWISA